MELAREVVAGRLELNDALKRLAFQDEVSVMIQRHGLNRALATQVALGQVELNYILAKRRVEAHLEANHNRCVLEEAVAKRTELSLGIHGHKTRRVKLSKVDAYEVTFQDAETKEEIVLHKLQIKYAFDPEVYKKLRKAMEFDKARRERTVEPIRRPQDRFACSDKRLGLAMDKKLEVTAVTVEGECFTGEIQWISRYEFTLRTRQGAEITIFRHALDELKGG